MKYTYFLLSFLIIGLIYSCSSDPCEEVTCVNGECIDGTCDCQEGYIGTECDQIDLLGTYYNYSILMDDNCSQEYKDYNPEAVGEATCDNLGCSALLYTFHSDLSYSRTFIEYTEEGNGAEVVSYESSSEGTYLVNGTTISLEGGRGNGVVFEYDKNVLSYYATFWQSCKATRYYKKRGS